MKLEDMMKKISDGRFKKTTPKNLTPTIDDYLSVPNPSRPYLEDDSKTKNGTGEKATNAIFSDN